MAISKGYPFNFQLRTWANFAINNTEQVSEEYSEMLRNLNKQDLTALLSYLAGFIGSDINGRKVIERALKFAK